MLSLIFLRPPVCCRYFQFDKKSNSCSGKYLKNVRSKQYNWNYNSGILLDRKNTLETSAWKKCSLVWDSFGYFLYSISLLLFNENDWVLNVGLDTYSIHNTKQVLKQHFILP